MKRRNLAVLGLLLSAAVATSCGTSVQDDRPYLTPVGKRNSDQTIARDLELLAAWEQRLAALPPAGDPATAYQAAKAAALLELSRHEYEINDRTGVVNSAFKEATVLIRTLELGGEATLEAPRIAGSMLVREDLWRLVDDAKRGAPFQCAAPLLAQLEVQLVWAGNEELTCAPDDPRPLQARAVWLAQQLENRAAECAPDFVLAQATAEAQRRPAVREPMTTPGVDRVATGVARREIPGIESSSVVKQPSAAATDTVGMVVARSVGGRQDVESAGAPEGARRNLPPSDVRSVVLDSSRARPELAAVRSSVPGPRPVAVPAGVPSARVTGRPSRDTLSVGTAGPIDSVRSASARADTASSFAAPAPTVLSERRDLAGRLPSTAADPIPRPLPANSATPASVVVPPSPDSSARPRGAPDGSPARVALPNTAHFALNSTEIGPPTARVLDQIVAALRAHTDIGMVLLGHADDRGGSAYNFRLGLRRAEAVREYFVARGVAAGRMSVVSHGELHHLAPGRSNRDRARNRRVFIEFVLSGPPAVDAVRQEEDLQLDGGRG